VLKLLQLIVVLALAFTMTACTLDSKTESTNTASSDTDTTSPTGNGEESVSLSWISPDTRADGDYLSLNDLAGFKVYMGTSENSLRQLVDLNDNQITKYTVNNLAAGSYYFAVSAYDQDGLESGFSQVIRIDVG
jgi:hypothetical protein